ncbi:putative gibberellin regulated protein [Helianthus annuus]|nr:putative gibberellin regulated protein [Helianthus annuus]
MYPKVELKVRFPSNRLHVYIMKINFIFFFIVECPSACSVRCSATHHSSNCMDVWQDCCGKCLCVLSGTVGNKNECSYYRDLKTKYETPKCL